MSRRNRSILFALAPPFLLFSLLLTRPLTAGSSYAHITSTGTSGWLGISIQNISEGIQESAGLESDQGVIVNAVTPESPAEEGGLKAGDVITHFNDSEIEGSGQFVNLVRRSKPGDEITLTVIRDGKRKEIVVALGERSEKEHPYELFEEGKPPILRHRGPHPFAIDIPAVMGGHIGVKVQDMNPQLAEAFGLKRTEGAFVLEADEKGPAYEAGIRGGDVIVQVDGEDIADVDDLRSVIREKGEGDEVEVAILRKKKEKRFTVKVDEAPGLSAMKKKIESIDLEDELEDLGEIRLEIREDLENEMADLREELEALKEELNDLRKELK